MYILIPTSLVGGGPGGAGEQPALPQEHEPVRARDAGAGARARGGVPAGEAGLVGDLTV